MSRYLSLSRAARLAGVSRGDLQDKIRTLALPTFEGQVAIEDLLRAYPDLDLERNPMLERVTRIKAEARPKRHYSDHWLPEAEVLMARLGDFQEVLTRTKAALNGAEQLLGEIGAQLEGAARAEPEPLRELVTRLAARLRQARERAGQRHDREAEIFARDALLRIMSASVRLLPSGREFFVAGRDSLLEAALKAGLHLDYGCASGNCGSCRVRVAQGQARKIREHDFVLSAQERQAGYVLACCHTAVSDLVLEAHEALSAADLPSQRIRCILRHLEPVADDLLLLQVQTPRTQTLRFLAGQRVLLITEDGQRRDLPVASCPCDARNLQFLVRQGPDDPFAASLLASGAGGTVLVEGPRGDFLLDEAAPEPALFVAVGEGLAPIKSLIEHAIAIDNAARLHLYRVDALRPGSPLDNLCRAWNDALDHFDCRRLGPAARPDEVLDLMLRDYPKLEECRLYLAAPQEWAGEWLAAARARGIDTHRLRWDAVD